MISLLGWLHVLTDLHHLVAVSRSNRAQSCKILLLLKRSLILINILIFCYRCNHLSTRSVSRCESRWRDHLNFLEIMLARQIMLLSWACYRHLEILLLPTECLLLIDIVYIFKTVFYTNRLNSRGYLRKRTDIILLTSFVLDHFILIFISTFDLCQIPATTKLTFPFLSYT